MVESKGERSVAWKDCQSAEQTGVKMVAHWVVSLVEMRVGLLVAQKV